MAERPKDPSQPSAAAPAARGWAPWFVLLVALAMSATGIAYVISNTESRDRVRFQNSAERVTGSIQNRLETYTGALRATAGLFAANRHISREQFATFVERLELQNRFPGIQGIGYAARVQSAARERFEREIRSNGLPDFHIWPDQSPRDEYYPIAYLEPMDARNLAAIGFDMHTEPIRRGAMDSACDSGRPAASGKVRLIQELQESTPQSGFLIYVPVYDAPEPPATVEGREATLNGFVYAPFRVDDLLRGIFNAEPHADIDFAIYDGQQVDADKLMHDSSRFRQIGGDAPANASSATSPPPRLQLARQITVSGRQWTIVLSSRPEFDAGSARWVVPHLIIGGIFVSVVLFLVTRGLARARDNAEKLAADLRRSQANLRSSESRFRRLADSNLIGVVFSDIHGRVIDGNDEYFRTIGYRREDALAGHVRWDAMTPAEYSGVEDTAKEELRQQGVCKPFEKEYVRPDGTRVPVLLGVAMLEGSASETVAFTVDLSARKQAERDLQAAKDAAENANRAKDRFLAVLSHELRTPLTPVLATIELHERDPDLPEVLKEDLALMRRNIELEARLIADLLDLTRVSRGKLQIARETVDVHAVIADAVATCCREGPEHAFAGVAAAEPARHIVMDLDAPRHHVQGDPARLQQVMWNLIKNAMKFTPRDGVITVRTRNEDVDRPAGAAELVIDVIDTGSGIAREMLPKVFEAFEQGQAEPARTGGGLGLGLSISKGLVESHGGRIAVHSDGPGHGATFTVRLPAIEVPVELPSARGLPQAAPCPVGAGAASQLQGGASETARRPGRVRILLVEDHPDTYVAMQRLLRLFGHDVKGARTLADALAVAADSEFDVLLSDIGLPDGTGLDLIRELRSRESNGHHFFKGIALTGFGMAEDQRRAHEAGFDAHLTKPVDIEALRETIERLSPAALPETADQRR